MYVVRNVFRALPGKAGELAGKFKAAGPLMVESGVVANVRVMTDTVAGFWTVVVESDVDDLHAYLDVATVASKAPGIGEALAGYMDLVSSGHREVFKVE